MQAWHNTMLWYLGIALALFNDSELIKSGGLDGVEVSRVVSSACHNQAEPKSHVY
jgi:hypothetical protein